MNKSSESYKVVGIKDIGNERPSNFNVCLLCDIPIKPQKIALVDFETYDHNYKSNMMTNIINNIICHYKTRIHYKSIKILNYSLNDNYLDNEKLKQSPYFANGRFEISNVKDIDVLESYSQHFIKKYNLNKSTYISSLCNLGNKLLETMNILIIDNIDDVQYQTNEFIIDLYTNYKKYNLWIIYGTGRLDNLYYNMSTYKIFKNNVNNIDRLKDYYKFGFESIINAFDTFLEFITHSNINDHLILMKNEANNINDNSSNSIYYKKYSNKFFYWTQDDINSIDLSTKYGNYLFKQNSLTSESSVFKNDSEIESSSELRSLKYTKKNKSSVNKMNNYFNNLIEKNDSGTTYHVKMLANSEKLVSYNYIPDLSNDDSVSIFTDDNSINYKYINKKMKSYNVDKYPIDNVDHIDKPTSILINGKNKCGKSHLVSKILEKYKHNDKANIIIFSKYNNFIKKVDFINQKYISYFSYDLIEKYTQELDNGFINIIILLDYDIIKNKFSDCLNKLLENKENNNSHIIVTTNTITNNLNKIFDCVINHLELYINNTKIYEELYKNFITYEIYDKIIKEFNNRCFFILDKDNKFGWYSLNKQLTEIKLKNSDKHESESKILDTSLARTNSEYISPIINSDKKINLKKLCGISNTRKPIINKKINNKNKYVKLNIGKDVKIKISY
jgi:hypothetical protein